MTVSIERALCVRQPWASAIASGEKTVEWRSWPTTYRGRILICASTARTPGYDHLYTDAPRGVMLCTVEVFDCVPYRKRKHGKAAMQADIDCDEGYAWILHDPRAVASVPFRGRLNLIKLTADERRAIRAA